MGRAGQLGVAAALTDGFVGREEELERLDLALSRPGRMGTSNHPIFLLGPPGAGVSTLLAMAGVRAKLRAPEAVVVFRFAGASPGATNARRLLDGVCRQLAAVFGGGGEPPTDLHALRAELVRRMGWASAESPVVVVVDGVDEVETAGGGEPAFDWVPAALPPHSALLCALRATSEACCAALNRRFSAEAFQTVHPLSGVQGAAVLEGRLALQGRPAFAAAHFERIRDCAHDSAGVGGGRDCSPLFVVLALGLATGWLSTDPAPPLPLTVAGLVDHLLARLAAAHGPLLVERAFGLLLAARDGLAWPEIFDVLSCDDTVVQAAYGAHPPSHCRLPTMVGRLFARDAEALLGRVFTGGVELRRAERWHVRRAVAERWGLERPGALLPYHSALAMYFSGQWAAGKVPGGWDASGGAGTRAVGSGAGAAAAEMEDRGVHPQPLFFVGRSELFAHRRAARPNLRRIRELPFHLLRASGRPAVADPVQRAAEPAASAGAGAAERAAQARFERHVCRLEFVEAACAVGQGPELAEDLLVARAVFKGSSAVRQFYRFMAGNAVDLARRSGLTLQQALNAAGHQDALNAAAAALIEEGVVQRRELDGWSPPQCWFVHTNREDFVDPRHGTLAGHYGGAFGAAVSGRDDVALTCGADGVVRVHDLQALREVRALEGHTAAVRRCRVSADGRRALTASADGTGALWDLMTGRAVRRLLGHEGEVADCCFISDYVAATASTDCTARIWDLASDAGDAGDSAGGGDDGGVGEAAAVVVLRGHASAVTSVVGMAGGAHVATGSFDRTVRVWEARAPGRCLLVLDPGGGDGPPGLVYSLAASPDGRSLLSCGSDAALRVWDLDRAEEAAVLRFHGAAVLCCDVDPTGRWAATGSADRTVRLAPLGGGGGGAAVTVGTHAAAVCCVAFSGTGQYLLSGGADEVVAVWDWTAAVRLAAGSAGGAAGSGVVWSVADPEHLRAARRRAGVLAGAPRHIYTPAPPSTCRLPHPASVLLGSRAAFSMPYLRAELPSAPPAAARRPGLPRRQAPRPATGCLFSPPPA